MEENADMADNLADAEARNKELEDLLARLRAEMEARMRELADQLKAMQDAFEKSQRDLQAAQKAIEERDALLKAEAERAAAALAALKAQLDAAEKKAKDDLAAMRKAFEEQISSMSAGGDEAMSTMSAAHDEAMANMERQKEEEMAGLRAEIDAFEETKRKALDELRRQHEKEMDEALVLVRLIQSKQADVREALRKASQCQETLSFIRPWKVNFLEVLEAAVLLGEIAGLSEDEILKYKGLLEGEQEKRKFREKLEKLARTKGTKREVLTEVSKEAREAGLTQDEVKDTETYWFQRSGKV